MRYPLFPFSLFLLILSSLPLSSSTHQTLTKGSELSVENPADFLTSPTGAFHAGFSPAGQNAFFFAVYFSNQSCTTDCIIWTPNRDKPVNGVKSKLTVKSNGDVSLSDAGYAVVWSTATFYGSAVSLQLHDSGNLVLTADSGETLWQSFDSPTDTLVPEQRLSRNTVLVSARARGNCSGGYYKLYFDNDNVLRLLYNGPDVSSVYWPDPWLVSMQTGRTTFNDSRVAWFDSVGEFTSSDGFHFTASDFGQKVPRRLTVDYDGNIRLYSLREKFEWVVTWQVIAKPCKIHGICGPNAMCAYNPSSGRSCYCAPGYIMKNNSDWTRGCEPNFQSFCQADTDFEYLELPQTDFYGYDAKLYENYTFEQCRNICSNMCNCKGFQYSFNGGAGTFKCYPKVMLLNGFVTLNDYAIGTMYIRVPRSIRNAITESSDLECTDGLVEVPRTYITRHRNKFLLRMLLIFAGSIGGIEMIVILLVWCFVIRTHNKHDADGTIEAYQIAPTGFRRYAFSELKKATRNFREEIGKGATGSVYRAVLPCGRTAAVKRLREASQGEEEFRAEVGTIGKLNHMNLIEMWGYCAEGKHRLLVYEYMTRGSLAENLTTGKLNWTARFDIAVGAARGLAYLHEECLEWVLHCDVKPQNILLDEKYHPKVADLGLSKLLSRGDNETTSTFSKIRGTRGYVAPEWVYNLPITSKVDVYSYGIVILEMVTGRGPSENVSEVAGKDNRRLAAWVREKVKIGAPMGTWIKEAISDDCDVKMVEILLAVALQCVAEDRDLRPTMSQVVEMLQRFENSDFFFHFLLS